MEFNIGDSIVIKENVPYVYTKYKSTGTVVEVGADSLYVRFNYFSGPSPLHGTVEYWINKDHCKPLEQIPQEEQILHKIKLIESRWISYQERKHSYV